MSRVGNGKYTQCEKMTTDLTKIATVLHRDEKNRDANVNEKCGLNHCSTAEGETARITASAATINAAATNAVNATLPRLAGNFPRIIQY